MNLRWMPLYVPDYRADTAHLGALEHGIYLLLIMHYWQTGSLPDDDRKLARIACATDTEWRRSKSTIEKFFTPGWKHGRIEEEIKKAEDNYARRIKYLKTLGGRRPDPLEWAAIRAFIFERDNYTCTYCGKQGGDLECDHIVPVYQNGSSDGDNLTTACKPCNRSKGARLVSEWQQ